MKTIFKITIFYLLYFTIILTANDSIEYYNLTYKSDFFKVLKISSEANKSYPLTIKIIKNDTINAKGYSVDFKIISAPQNSKAYIQKENILSNIDGQAVAYFNPQESKGKYVVRAIIGEDYHHPFYINIEVLKSNWYLTAFFGLLGGLALFIYGMNQTGSGLKNLAGQQLKQLLGKATKYKSGGYLLGVISTFLMQSSSAVSVLIIGFTTAGLMTFKQSLSVLLGSCLGTTLTVQLISFNIGDFALLFVFLGFVITSSSKSKKYKLIGKTIMGFGLIFYGMKVMSVSMAPLKGFPIVIDILTTLENSHLLAILIATIFTSLVQSSAATIGILLSLSGQGMMGLEGAIAFILGANIGTSITGILASFSQNLSAKKVAWANVAFKVIGVIIFFPFISYFATFMESFNLPIIRNIANAHTLFNLLFTLLLLPFSNKIGQFVSYLFRNSVSKESEFKIKYLNDSLFSSPDIALDHVLREILRMAEILDQMFRKIPDFLTHSDLSEIDKSRLSDNKIDYLEENIKHYLVKLSKYIDNDHKLDQINAFIIVANTLESMGDVVVRTIYSTIVKIRTENLPLSAKGLQDIVLFHEKVLISYRKFLLALRKEDANGFEEIIELYKPQIRRLEAKLLVNHIERLKSGSLETTATSSRHVDLLNSLKRFNSLTHNLTYQLLEVYKDRDKKEL